MTKKIAVFAFNGEPMCFIHSLMNSLEMKEKGYDVKLIIEGSATRLIREAVEDKKPFTELYEKARDSGLIDCVCRACAAKTESLESAKEQNLALRDEMSGHPSMTRYLEDGYEVIVF
ncbi:DsrE family protein [Methanolobus sp. ZRKC3]|uniref:DsrE family protein n=1 Tax=Methanolobus sp. ZRKC3 TaxID=3125786 RepID=UPI003253E463